MHKNTTKYFKVIAFTFLQLLSSHKRPMSFSGMPCAGYFEGYVLGRREYNSRSTGVLLSTRPNRKITHSSVENPVFLFLPAVRWHHRDQQFDDSETQKHIYKKTNT